MWNAWKRAKACIPCLYYADRDDVAGINITTRGVSAYKPAAVPGQAPGRWVAGDWEQCDQQQLVQNVAGRLPPCGFPYVGEGRRPKGSAEKPGIISGGRATPGRPPGCIQWFGWCTARILYVRVVLYASWTHPCVLTEYDWMWKQPAAYGRGPDRSQRYVRIATRIYCTHASPRVMSRQVSKVCSYCDGDISATHYRLLGVARGPRRCIYCRAGLLNGPERRRYRSMPSGLPPRSRQAAEQGGCVQSAAL